MLDYTFAFGADKNTKNDSSSFVSLASSLFFVFLFSLFASVLFHSLVWFGLEAKSKQMNT